MSTHKGYVCHKCKQPIPHTERARVDMDEERLVYFHIEYPSTCYIDWQSERLHEWKTVHREDR